MDRWKINIDWLKCNGHNLFAATAILYCIALAAVVYGRHFELSPYEVLKGDALQELREWIAGASFAERLRHNDAQSPIQSLLLWLDIALGPFGWWSRTIAILSFATGAVMLGLSVQSLAGRTAAFSFWSFAATIWFADANAPQALTSSWRMVEVGGQWMAIGAGALLVRRLILLEKIDRTALALLLLIFAFSHVHKGFVIVFSVLSVVLLVSRTRENRFIASGLIVIYLVYGFLVEGVLSRTFFAAGNSDASFVLIPQYVFSTFDLATQSAVDLFAIDSTPVARAAQVGLSIIMLFCSVFALYQIIRKDRKLDAVPLLLIGAGLIMAFLSVVARYDQYGSNVANIPRFWSDGLFCLFGVLLFGLTRMSTKYIIISGVALVIGATFPLLENYSKAGARERYNLAYQNLLYAQMLNSNIDFSNTLLPRHHRSAFLEVAEYVEDNNVGYFGYRPFRRALLNNLPIPTTSFQCAGNGRLISDSQEPYQRWDLNFDQEEVAPVDFAVVYIDGEIITFGLVRTLDRRRTAVDLFMPNTNIPKKVILFEYMGDGESDAVCFYDIQPDPAP